MEGICLLLLVEGLILAKNPFIEGKNVFFVILGQKLDWEY